MSSNESDKHCAKKRKKCTEDAFRTRIENRVIEKIGNDKNLIELSPFKTWFQSYIESLTQNNSVCLDVEYNSIKNALITGTVTNLSYNLQRKIQRNVYKIRKIDLIDQNSIADRNPTNEDDISYSKELVSMNNSKCNNPGDDENSILGSSSINQTPKYKIVVPVSKVAKVIHKFHTNSSVHTGSDKCHDNISKYFRGIPRIVVREYIRRCAVCQAREVVTEKEKRRQTFLQPIQAGALFQLWQIDLCQIKDYVPSLNKFMWRYIVKVVDHKSKFRFADTMIRKESIFVVQFLEKLFAIVGPPQVLQSDNGGEFQSEAYILLCQRWGIQIIYSSPRHPQSNGLIERANRTLKKAVTNWQRSNPTSDWASALPILLHRLNCIRQATIGIDPYFYVYGIKSWNELSFVQSILMLNPEDFADEDDNADLNDLNDSSSADSPLHPFNNHEEDCEMKTSIEERSEASTVQLGSLNVQNDRISMNSSIIIPISKPLLEIPPLPVLFSQDEQEIHSGVANICLDDGDASMEESFSITSHYPTATNLDHRQVADATYKHKIGLMAQNYNKKVIPTTYKIGDVVGINIDPKWRHKQPSANRFGNIPSKIVGIYQDTHNNTIRYKVRTAHYVVKELFCASNIVQLCGGAESYPKEHKWETFNNVVDNLPTIGLFELFMELSLSTAAVIDLTLPQSNHLQSYDPSELYDAKCAICSEFMSSNESVACSGCRGTIHNDVDKCQHSSQRIVNNKSIYCNIYCANVDGFYPTLPGYRPIQDTQADNISSYESSVMTH
jgi:hypothetical protein